MTMLAVALPWTHRLVDQSPPRGAGSAYCDRPTKLDTTSTASQTGGQPPQQHTVGVEIPIASDAPHCPTSRGFLPWRFADAGPECIAPPSWGRHPKTFTQAAIPLRSSFGPGTNSVAAPK